MKKHTDSPESIPTMNEDKPTSMGQIKINHAVVASIVRIAATEIDGVYSIGSSFVDGITEFFSSKRETDKGVRVTENEAGEYLIEVRVYLRFGVELANVAVQIQDNIAKHVEKMTMKKVTRVDVIIDGVKTDESKPHNPSDLPKDYTVQDM